MPANTAITWIYIGPSLVLSALIALLAVRFLLVLAGGGSNRIVPPVLLSITDPVERIVRCLTPSIAPNLLVLALAITWLMGARIVWIYACIAGGLRPSLGG